MEADSTALPLEDLMAHSGWVRALAARLLGDVDQADDVVQETWLAALRNPPRRGGNARAWLGRVVRNAVHDRGRSGARRRARETVVAGERGTAPSSDELVEEVETQRRVAACVLELDEPYRETVLLRYFEGLSSAAIGRRLDVPEGTVRWRLKQGVDELRHRLDDGYGSRRAWCLALVPLARRDALLSGGAGAAGGTGAFSLLRGLLAMNFGLKLTLLTTTALAAAWFTPLGGLALELLPSQRPAELGEVSAIYRPLEPAATRAAAPAPPAARVPAASDDEALDEVARVTLEVLGPERWPLAGAQVRVAGYSEDSVVTDAEGRATVPVPDAWNFAAGHRARLTVHAPGCLPGEVMFLPLEGRTVEAGALTLEPAGAVEGRVFDAYGQPLAGAHVRAGTVPKRQERLEEQRIENSTRVWGDARTDREGRFLLRSVAVGEQVIWAILDGHEANCSGGVEVRARQVASGVEIRLGELDPGDYVTGIVIDPSGQPVPRAKVNADFKTLTRSGNRSVSTDLEGRFRLPWVPRAPFDLRASDPQRRFTDAVAEEVEGSPDQVVLRFTEAKRMTVHATSTDGRALELAVAAWDRDRRRTLAPLRSSEDPGPSVQLLVPNETFWIEANAAGFDPTFLGPFDPGATPADLKVELTPQPGVRGRVLLGERGVPGVTVSLWPVAVQRVTIQDFPVRVSSSAAATALTEPDGTFLLNLEESGRYYLRAESSDRAPVELGPLELDREEGLGDVELHLTDGGSIEGQVLSPNGLPVGGTVVAISRGDGHARAQRVGSNGRFRFDRLVPGPWLVQRHGEEILRGDFSASRGGVSPFTEADIESNCVVVEGEVTRFDLGNVGAPPVLVGRLLLDGEAPEGWSVQLVAANQGLMSVSSGSDGPTELDEEGSFELEAPRPGRYRLHLQSPGALAGAGVILSSELELHGGPTPWTRDLATGSVAVENPAPAHELGIPLDFLMGTVEGLNVLAPVGPRADGAATTLDSIPAGSHRMVRFTLEELVTLEEFPTTQSGLVDVLVRPGETARIRMP